MDVAVLGSLRTAIAGPPESVDLFAGVMAIAALSGSQPDAGSVGRQIDLIAQAVEAYCDDLSDPVEATQAIDYQLFTVLAFRGAVEDYSDPANSYLDVVLERRTGIPISLSVLYLEVARRIGVPCAGIGYPGHFLVRAGSGDGTFFIDPFSQGLRIDAAELLARLQAMDLGGARPESFLQPVTSRQILQRMLANLRASYRERRDFRRWRDSLEFALCLEPWNSRLVGERGMVNYRLGNFAEALEDLERYVGAVKHGAVALGAVRLLDELRSRLGQGRAE